MSTEDKNNKPVADESVNDTVADAPDKVVVTDEKGKDKKIDAEDLPKTVNIPVSASNALNPDAGIQIPVAGELTEEVLKTDPQNPEITKVQNVLKDDAELDSKVSKEKYEQLVTVFNEILDNHNIDVVHKQYYKAKAGIELPVV